MKSNLLIQLCFLLLTLGAAAQVSTKSENKTVTAATNTVANENNLIDYLTTLTADTEKHREYLREYYQQLIWTITGAVTVFGGALTIFGARILKAIKKEAQEMSLSALSELKIKIKQDADLINEEIKRDLMISSEGYKTDVESFKEQLRVEHSNVKAELANVQEQLRNISQLYKDLKGMVGAHFQILNSINYLEYLKADGSEISVKVEQLICCVNEDSPVAHRDHFMNADTNGRIEVIQSSPTYSIIKNHTNSKGARLHFDEPLTINHDPISTSIKWKIYDAYTGDEEYFTIFQRNENVEEVVIIKFLKERPSHQHDCESINLFNEVSKLAINPIISFDDIHQIVEIKLPIVPAGHTHKIIWKMEESG